MHADIHLQTLVWCDAAQRLLYINHEIESEVGRCILYGVDVHIMITPHLLQSFLISKSETSDRTNTHCKSFGKTQSYLFETDL